MHWHGRYTEEQEEILAELMGVSSSPSEVPCIEISVDPNDID